jgi:hypothetical protein
LYSAYAPRKTASNNKVGIAMMVKSNDVQLHTHTEYNSYLGLVNVTGV